LPVAGRADRGASVNRSGSNISSLGSDTGQAGVAILLSTFNGAQYLSEQLSSFTAQTHADWLLYWRDDGSSDASPSLVGAFAAGAGAGRCTIAQSENHRLGAAGSFLTLLRQALGGTAEFFAFSDQDDVWLPEKLAHGVAALAALPATQPALYFCARAPVDATLQPLGQALRPRRPPGFPASLTQNVAPGCCMMLNRAAAKLIDSTAAPEGTWHDWWCYIVVSASGGTVIAGVAADILYRQHGQNIVGEPLSFWQRTTAAFRRGRGPFMTLFRRQIEALKAAPFPLPDHTSRLLAIIDCASHGGPLARLRALFIPGFVRQTRAETALFRLWFLLG
jgi:hypothetical protein